MTTLQRVSTDLSSRAPARVPDAAPDRRIRLLSFVGNFCRGGTEGQAVAAGLALDAARFDLRFGCFINGGELAATVAAHVEAVGVYPMRGFWSRNYVRQVFGLARDLRRQRIQVVHSYGFYCHMVAIPAARLAGVPAVIASVRDCGVYLTPAQRRVQRYLCRLADRVLVNATAVRTWLTSLGVSPDTITVVPNGVDMARFQAVNRPARSVRAEFGFAPDCPLIVVVARLSQAKGIDYLIDATPSILSAHPAARVLLVGPDDWGGLARLSRRVEALGLTEVIRFAGDRSDVPAILAQATISVLPSLSEAMPNGVLESMAAGVPVVATRVGGIPEAIRDGVNGLLVPPADADALSRAICRLIADPREARRLGDAGRDTVTRHFSLEQSVRSTSDVYLDLLGRKGRALHQA